jgi:hypothetical protein
MPMACHSPLGLSFFFITKSFPQAGLLGQPAEFDLRHYL